MIEESIQSSLVLTQSIELNQALKGSPLVSRQLIMTANRLKLAVSANELRPLDHNNRKQGSVLRSGLPGFNGFKNCIHNLIFGNRTNHFSLLKEMCTSTS